MVNAWSLGILILATGKWEGTGSMDRCMQSLIKEGMCELVLMLFVKTFIHTEYPLPCKKKCFSPHPPKPIWRPEASRKSVLVLWEISD